MSDAESARKIRRRHMHERQAVVFGVILSPFSHDAFTRSSTVEKPVPSTVDEISSVDI